MQIFFLESPKSVILQMCVYCVLSSTYASPDVMDSRVIDQRETFSPAHSVRGREQPALLIFLDVMEGDFGL